MSMNLELQGDPQDVVSFLRQQCAAIHRHYEGRPLCPTKNPTLWRLGRAQLSLSVRHLSQGWVRVEVERVGNKGVDHGEC